MTNHFKSARGSKIVMEGGDRQRGAIQGREQKNKRRRTK